MILRPTILGVVAAFLKRRSQVRLLPGTLLFSKDLHRKPPPGGPRIPVRNRVSGTDPVQGRSPYSGLGRIWREAGVPPVWPVPSDDLAADGMAGLRTKVCS